MHEEKNDSKGLIGNKNILVAITIFTLVTFNIVQFFINNKDGEERARKYEEKQLELVETYAKLDTISIEVEEKIAQINSLGGKVDALISMKHQLESEKYALLKAKDLADTRFNDIKNSLQEYERLLAKQDLEIALLQEKMQSLEARSMELEADKNRMAEALSSLKEENTQLSTKVKQGAVLQTKGIKILSIGKEGRPEEGPRLRGARMIRLKALIQIAPNTLVAKGPKRIYMSIVDERNSYTSQGGESIRIKGEDVFYAASQDFMFDQTEKEIAITHDKAYGTGKYTANFYCDGELVGQTQFIVY